MITEPLTGSIPTDIGLLTNLRGLYVPTPNLHQRACLIDKVAVFLLLFCRNVRLSKCIWFLFRTFMEALLIVTETYQLVWDFRQATEDR